MVRLTKINQRLMNILFVDNKIRINNPDMNIVSFLVPLLTYNNPEYYKKKEMGISVHKTPQYIEMYEFNDDNTVLSIPRGEWEKVSKAYDAYAGGVSYKFSTAESPISLQYINDDFALDEYQEGAIEALKQHRQGVIHAVTSAGKSLIILKAICELKQRSVIVVHRKVLMQQFLEDIDKYIRDEHGKKIEPGIIGAGSNTIGPITIAIDKTLSRLRDSYRESFGAVFLDECHICPATTINTLINGINSTYRFGTSGTLKRKDGKEFMIFSTFGGVIYTIGKEVLLEKGRVVPVVPKILESETKFDWDSVVEGLTEQGDRNPTQKARQLQDKTIMYDEKRNKMILDHVSKLKGKTIVLSRFVAPCYLLQKDLKETYGIEAGIITGKDAKGAIKSYEAMKHDDLSVIFATVGCVSTGVSISDLDHVVLISPIYTNELLLHQIRGRLMRKADGKTFGTLHFVYDPYIFPNHKLKKFLKIIES